jgi:1-acyl-sn-glycerol-3-phosphate acyltransferase
LLPLLKILLIFFVILILIPIQYFIVLTNLKCKSFIPLIFHKTILKVLGIKLKLLGEKSNIRPLVLVGNHTSYLDIIILGSIMPISFIAKEEISNWFLFGFLAKMQNTIFIKRKNYKTLESLKNINKTLDTNSVIVLFPEGTTNAGKKILNFKSSFFNLFENNNTLRLQNFSLCYTHINDMPIDNRTRPQISWYGDMDIISHLSNLLKFSCLNATIVFHPILSIKGVDRKTISVASFKQVKEGIEKAFINL